MTAKAAAIALIESNEQSDWPTRAFRRRQASLVHHSLGRRNNRAAFHDESHLTKSGYVARRIAFHRDQDQPANLA